jgi:hypothetical protein
MTRPSSRALAVLAVGMFALEGAAETLAAEIVELVPNIRDERISVSFRVEDAFSEDIVRSINTGLEVSFRYNVELKRARFGWFDEKAAAREIRTTVIYDNLTKRYSLTREIDGEIDATEVVANADRMRRFMTHFESLTLFDVSLMRRNEEYYLRVGGILEERNLLLLIPWNIAAEWREAHFTYMP